MEKLPSHNEALPSEEGSEDDAEEQNLVVVEETVLEEPSSPESPTSYDESVETVASAEDERVGEDLQEETNDEAMPVETNDEAMPVETNDEAMPVETKEEVLPVIPVHKPNDDNPSYPMSEEPIADPVPGKAGKSHAWLYTIITLLLMAVSYVGGHYQILNNISIDLYTETHSDAPQDKETSPEETDNALPSEEMADTLQNDTSAVDSTLAPSPAVPVAPQEDPAEIAKYFPQVPGGEYWIVGDAGYVHHMQVGETLYRIARKELGDQNLVRYLIVFNKFEDPNIIHTGDPIRIPKLVKKEQKEPAQASAE